MLERGHGSPQDQAFLMMVCGKADGFGGELVMDGIRPSIILDNERKKKINCKTKKKIEMMESKIKSRLSDAWGSGRRPLPILKMASRYLIWERATIDETVLRNDSKAKCSEQFRSMAITSSFFYFIFRIGHHFFFRLPSFNIQSALRYIFFLKKRVPW